jgi:DNA end-binding protein Ku
MAALKKSLEKPGAQTGDAEPKKPARKAPAAKTAPAKKPPARKKAAA